MESDRFRKRFIYKILVDLVPIRAMGKKQDEIDGLWSSHHDREFLYWQLFLPVNDDMTMLQNGHVYIYKYIIHST